jgi:hypothetical protein
LKETVNKRSGLRLLVRCLEKLEPLTMVGGRSFGYLVRLMFPERFGCTRRVCIYDPGAESTEREGNK